MNGFSFPPPPPPPPKAASSSSSQPEQPNQFNNRGGRGGGGRGGRGGRGSFRGRGGAPQRGGGNFQPQNNNNSGYGQHNPGSYQPSYGNQQQQYQPPQQYQNSQQYQAPQQYPPPQQYQAPPGSYVNPAFSGMQAPTYSQPQVLQYGQQSVQNSGQSNPSSYGNLSNASSPLGEKRTRDQAFGQSNRGHPMKKPSSAPKVQVAPAIPSFGAPILPQKPPAPISSGGGLKQRPSAGLGLIPKDYASPENSDDNEEDEEEEDVDEEAALSALQDGPLSFEFNGELSTLGSAADIAEWIAERRKRWPSKRRVEEKEQEVLSRMEERRRIEQETRAAIASASGGEYQPVVREDCQQRPMRKPATERQARQKDDSTLEDTQKELALQKQKVEELQRLLAERGQAPVSAETADQMIDTAQPPAEIMDLDQAPTDQLDQDFQQEATSSALVQHLDSDSDAPPEETSSKPSHPIRVPPPAQAAKTQPNPQQAEAKPCVSFANQGRCKFGNKCRYKHDASSAQEKGKRKTLYQRLVEQETDEENKLALQAIKYLGGVGFFSKHAAST